MSLNDCHDLPRLLYNRACYVRMYINHYTNKCRKFAKVAKIVSVIRVTTKVKISIFGDAAI